MQLFNWGEERLRDIIDSLRNAGVPHVGIDMISGCLLPNPDARPSSMGDILKHPFWKEMRRNTTIFRPTVDSQHHGELLHCYLFLAKLFYCSRVPIWRCLKCGGVLTRIASVNTARI